MSDTTREKTLELASAIHQLYSVEGKSLNYISKLFGLQRKKMTEVIKKELRFEQAYVRQTTPRIQKLLNQHKDGLIAYCVTTKERCLKPYLDLVGLNGNILGTMRANDPELDYVINTFTTKESESERERKRIAEKKRVWSEELQDLPGEVWKDVLGHEGVYWVSNLARVKNEEKILRTSINPRSNRHQIHLINPTTKKVKCHKLYRVVALAFLDNPCNLPTVNHKDGDIDNNYLENLEWASYSEQNNHRLHELKREVAKAYKKNGKFKNVLIDDQYSFKTIKAAGKFLGVSETTMQRYISGESKIERKIELIY